MQIDNQEIPLNPIMSKVLINIITGFIDALKGVPDDMKKINVEISI